MNEDLSFVIVTSPNDEEVLNAIESVFQLGKIFLIDGGDRLDLNKPAIDIKLIEKLAIKFQADYTYLPYQYSALSYNYGINKIGTGYIFILDSDEVIDEQMQKWLKSGAYRDYPIYKIKRINYFAGVPIKHGHLKPDWNIRLFKKGYANYENREVHARIIFETKPKKAGGLMLHFSNPTVNSYFLKMIHYSTREVLAREKKSQSNEFKSRIRTIIQKLPMQGLIKFIYSYIYKLGILDGRIGFKLALTASYYEVLVSLKKKYK